VLIYKIPQQFTYICAECGHPVKGNYVHPGIVNFYCSECHLIGNWPIPTIEVDEPEIV
jgi:DNA-directed RNA polymerase subunit RPC12/RpoP